MNVVIPSEARNLALETKDLRDSSSPAAPRNDRLDGFFSILLELRTVLGEDIGPITEQAERFLRGQEQDPECLNDLAWRFCESGRGDILTEAEGLARKAVESKKTDNWMAVHTLAIIMTRQGRCPEALYIAPSLFDAAAESETAMRACIEFAISAASTGYASDVLRILRESKGKTALEPLEVGLRKFLKESPLTAQEISEVANDVAERIRQAQAKTDPSSNRAE